MLKIKPHFLLLALLAPLSATAISNESATTGTAIATVSSESSYDFKDLNEQLVLGVLWVERSAEYKALCLQAYNIAKFRLDQELAIPHKKPLAVVVDIDETVLSNSPYQAWLIGKNQSFSSETWKGWIDSAEAIAMPGAVEFLNYAKSNGVNVFYITNRSVNKLDATLQNLQNQGFPYADEEHLMLKTDTDDKTARRTVVRETYEIVILMGDSLTDFINDFAGKTLAEQSILAEQNINQWGDRFIVLPNPEYGNWENAIYDYAQGLSAEQKDQMRKNALERWQPKK